MTAEPAVVLDTDARQELPQPFRLGRLPALDGVRGLACLAILLHHAALYIIVPAASHWTAGLWLGVDAFFVLSGFLITTLLTEEHARRGSISFRRFYARRALRLLPALFALIAGTILFATIFFDKGSAGMVRRSAAPALFYFMNWRTAVGDPTVSPLDITWSLSIEEQFYLLWPPILFLLLRSRLPRRVVVSVLILAALASFAWGAHLWSGGAPWRRVYYGTDTHADGLLLGCALSLLITAGVIRPGRLLWVLSLFAAGIVAWLFATMDYNTGFAYTAGQLLAVTAIAVCLARTVVDPPRVARRFLEHPWLRWVGVRSYGLYLYHWPIYLLMAHQFDRPLTAAHQVVTLASAVPLTFAAAALSYRFIEKPFLRLKPYSDRPLSRQADTVPQPTAQRVV